MATNFNEDKIGSLWKKEITLKDGTTSTVLTGEINGQRVNVYSNKKMKERKVADGSKTQEEVDRWPDYTVLKDNFEPKKQNGNSNGAQRSPQRAPQRAQNTKTGPVKSAPKRAPEPADEYDSGGSSEEML